MAGSNIRFFIFFQPTELRQQHQAHTQRDEHVHTHRVCVQPAQRSAAGGSSHRRAPVMREHQQAIGKKQKWVERKMDGERAGERLGDEGKSKE